MQTEVTILEIFIKDKYRSKTAFAEALGMTSQNLNHHIREAKKNGNQFSDDFKSKMEYKGIFLFRKPTNDFVTGANEPEVMYKALLKSKDEIIELLKEKVEQLEEKARAPVIKTKTGG